MERFAILFGLKSKRPYAFREGLGGISAWFCEMPRDKKDLPLEANLFWFDEGMYPERVFVG